MSETTLSCTIAVVVRSHLRWEAAAVENCFSKITALPAAGVYVIAVDQVGRSKLLGTVDQR